MPTQNEYRYYLTQFEKFNFVPATRENRNKLIDIIDKVTNGQEKWFSQDENGRVRIYKQNPKETSMAEVLMTIGFHDNKIWVDATPLMYRADVFDKILLENY